MSPEFIRDTRTAADYQEIAQELFDKLTSVDYGYWNTGTRSAEIVHPLRDCVLYLKYSLNIESEVVCHASASYFQDPELVSFIGSVILKRKRSKG